jgi:hypothetical protein
MLFLLYFSIVSQNNKGLSAREGMATVPRIDITRNTKVSQEGVD